MRRLIAPLSALYAAVGRARRRAYERHPEWQRKLHQPVISVGNISVGGSGKTPAVAHIARLLLAEGERPSIVTRGYRRRKPTVGPLVVSDGQRILADAETAGDEPLMLAQSLPGVRVVVGADRFLAGLAAEKILNCTVHILDDGFQHLQLMRDIDVLMVSEDDLHDHVLPAGRLREDTSALLRADAIIIMSGSGVPVPGFDGPRFTGAQQVRKSDSAEPVFAVAGIARPRRFFDRLSAAGWHVSGEMVFPDHRWFTARDLERMDAAARRSGAKRIVTTEKDFVRLVRFQPFPMPIAAVPLEFSIEPAKQFHDWLCSRLDAKRHESEGVHP